MIFNVSTLLGEPVGASRYHTLGETSAHRPPLPPGAGVDRGGAADSATRPASGAARLMRTATGVLVSADLTVETELECARCLSRFRRPTEIAFDEEFLPHRDPLTGLPPANADPDAFQIDAHQHLDLSEAIRQYEQAALPISPLCREGCAGLCPRCGTDRNESHCGCSGGDEDPRWSALTALASAFRQEEDRRGTPQA